MSKGEFDTEGSSSPNAEIVKESQRLAKIGKFEEALRLVTDLNIQNPKFETFRNQLRIRASQQREKQKARRKRIQIVAVVVGVVILIVLISVPLLYQNIASQAINETRTAAPTQERIFTEGEFAGYTCREMRATLVADGKTWAASACDENISDIDAEATHQAVQVSNQAIICQMLSTRVAEGTPMPSDAPCG